MASKNLALYTVWSDIEQKSYGEFLNFDCAIRHLGTMILRLSAKEYAKYLYENRKNMTENDYYYYGRIYLDEYYASNMTIRRKLLNEQSQGYIDFDPEYVFEIKNYIDKEKLLKSFVEIAFKVVGRPGKAG